MSDITNTNFSDSLKWRNESAVSSSTNSDNNEAMTQEDFFSLLTTQLAAQDPTKPTDNDQMIAQMTQFTMADGISGLSKKFDEFAGNFGDFMGGMQAQQTSNKALQASSMVGREVLVANDEAALFQYGEESYGMAGQLMFEGSKNDIRVNIKDQSGKILTSLEVGAANDGPLNFGWDGKDSNGNQLPAGVYQIEASGIDANSGLRSSLTTGSFSTVDSVRFGSGNELTMNLRGLGSFNMKDIIEVAP
jgi:flagellar basal-body rod modification protein FlgD